ncbi:hypothetical protein K493DRAFT_273917 [Basidiobolus meristosporus CBS 931.73]|uniref:MIR domain-containing protein n=1 Tax=Basidiobolus meristosporus CBS 931.73 TaxID=1314790 RepID=A0A1Y1Z976_9FUNG|nr:hypothetical protein K493DRAFT_273917 [Basidiobolus meristosporus CBS 931.73]|eukprot:ORY06823.1 hypothetical protein K493DRAFT_273917 [Basidiobolus meristosporus CBS 931.73]
MLKWPRLVTLAFTCFLLSEHLVHGAISYEIDEDFEKVTCGSALKLSHSETGYRLHSHEIPYGSGSRQQSVTALPTADDTNSFWIVKGALGENCPRGQPIECNSVVRLQHMNTKTHLHSHLHDAPMSNYQEISAYQGEDSGDHWKVLCSNTQDSSWIRNHDIHLHHVDTGKYLSTDKRYTYHQHVIYGQLEVHALSQKSKSTAWKALEGIYFADRNAADN